MMIIIGLTMATMVSALTSACFIGTYISMSNDIQLLIPGILLALLTVYLILMIVKASKEYMVVTKKYLTYPWNEKMSMAVDMLLYDNKLTLANRTSMIDGICSSGFGHIVMRNMLDDTEHHVPESIENLRKKMFKFLEDNEEIEQKYFTESVLCSNGFEDEVSADVKRYTIEMKHFFIEFIDEYIYYYNRGI